MLERRVLPAVNPRQLGLLDQRVVPAAAPQARLVIQRCHGCRSPSRARLGHCCRYERILCIPITGDIVVERRGQISLQLRVGASYLGMVAQIVTKQKTVLPPGIVSLQNMEVVCPWPGKSLP